jgi:ribonuclease HI
MDKEVIIYTDGSCLGNPGVGGWAAILIYGNHQKEIYGNELSTTNNRMEMKAVIEALKTLKFTCKIKIYTDSKYVYQGITEYILRWQQRNWRTSTGAVKNLELWKELLALTKQHQIDWFWVKAHNGNKYNEIVDKLANQSAQALKNGENNG